MKTARPNDTFWDFVVKLDDGSFKCTFCGYKFAPATSISRIKWHLSGVKGRGVRICDEVTEDIKDAARAAIDGSPEKKHKAIEGSSNYYVANTISTSAQEQNCEQRNVEMAQQGEQIFTGEHGRPITEQENQADVGSIQVGGQGLEQCVKEERICSQLEAINLVDRMASEPWNKINEVSTFLLEKDDVENNNGRLAQPGAGATSSGVRKYNTNESKGDPLPTSSTKPVGRAFEENTKVIWTWLMNDEVSTISIYGMGGVGKTRMLQHIHNELLQRQDISHHVYWVVVSRDFSIKRLQNLIAKHLHLDLSSEDDDLRRAVKLSKELRDKQEWILILDDLWNHFELHEVGIPIPLKGCKLIMTTRSRTVCERMDSRHKIKVKPLFEREAWALFMEKLGHDTTLSPEVERIAVEIARECAGLPLGIITMAGSLKGVHGLHEWRNTLKKLKELKFRDMEEKVFRLLRFSYDRLDDIALQQCLLYCALFPEDRVIIREELIFYLIDEGIIEEMRSLEEEFDEGHTMLDRLENVCLLESHSAAQSVKMHDLVRDMAIQIQQEDTQSIVKAGTQLKELPDIKEWTENLRRVSLMHNEIEEIPSIHSPRCLTLSTLLLCHNFGLRFIEDSFFKQFLGLKVLDLSKTAIEHLPDSVFDLVSLTTLLLKDCVKLRHVPSLEKLTALKRLDLLGTRLENMPEGLECLTNLRCLKMNGLGKNEGCGKDVFPCGILPKLTHLQVLVLHSSYERGSIPFTVKVKEVACLRKLERLACHFEGDSELVEFLRSQDETLLRNYIFFVGPSNEGKHILNLHSQSQRRGKFVWLGNLSINKDGYFQPILPKDTEVLLIYRSLCDVPSLIKYATQLNTISIDRCDSMESLVSSSWLCSTPRPLPPYNGMFSSVRVLRCYKCSSMKKLFPVVLLPNLVNLETISVKRCENMEEIIGTSSHEKGVMGGESSSTKFKLPKLRYLGLTSLPKLKSICGGQLICDSLRIIKVKNCEKLKRMPICLPLLENGEPSPPPSLREMYIYPKEWWESVVVEWEHPNAKDVLRPFVIFLK